MQYFFILGKNPILSKAEIEAILELESKKYKVIKFYEKVLILETDTKLDVDWLNQRLGGTIKIGLILDKIKRLEKFEDKFFKLIKVAKGKVHFGFSLYPLAPNLHLKKYQKELRPVAMEIKRKLREEKNLNSRWVVSKEPELSSVIVKKNQLLKYGSEICFFIKDKEILVGQTLAVQLFEEFGARDYQRPGRDEISGMLPPKLAKIMINLAQPQENWLILDPFCGSGTILQEALLMGYQNLIGFDKSEKAVADTQNNLKWLISKYDLPAKNLTIKKADVQNLSEELGADSIDAIITEPFLGPPLKGNESAKQIKQIIKDLEILYIKAFRQFAKALKKKGKILIVCPVFKSKEFTGELDILSKISQLGFKLLNKEPLIYSRPKQYIWREILILEK